VRRFIQARLKSREGFGADDEQGAVEQRLLGRAAGGVQHEVCLGLPGNLRGSVDQHAVLGLDAEIRSTAPRRGPGVWHGGLRSGPE
jgi:hypothetical protein